MKPFFVFLFMVLFLGSGNLWAATDAREAQKYFRSLLASGDYVGTFRNGKACVASVRENNSDGSVSVALFVAKTLNFVSGFRIGPNAKITQMSYDNDGDAVYFSLSTERRYDSDRVGWRNERSTLILRKFQDDKSVDIEISSSSGQSANCRIN